MKRPYYLKTATALACLFFASTNVGSAAEATRDKLLQALDNVRVVAQGYGMKQFLQPIDDARKAVLESSPSQFYGLPPVVENRLSMVELGTRQLRLGLETANETKKVVGPPQASSSTGFNSDPLDAPPYPTVDWDFVIEALDSAPEGNAEDESESGVCGYPGYGADHRFTVLNAAIVAEAAKDISEQICGEDILGENVSLLCIVTDILAYVNIGINENEDLCNDFVTAAEVTANWNGIQVVHGNVQHIHDDLGVHDANIDGDLTSHDTNMTTQHAALSSQLSQHDVDIKSQVGQHDSDIKDLLSLLQGGVDNANRQLTVALAVQRELVRLLLIPEGRRTTTPTLLSCDGDTMSCPDILPCADADCVAEYNR